ncbi:hypothetical protein Ciccas_004173 [Cichlidogyrus casuarinus]|uniref:Tetraspanin n=1 Tax=Cichlidogyrus casuarinus TaxID=1844966 RepID=A0ABD2QEK7_9PLAT
MSGQLNGSEEAHQKAKKHSAISHRFSLFANTVMICINITALAFTISIYVHWRSRYLVYALQELIQFHLVVCSIMIFSFFTICVGTMTMRALVKTMDLMIGFSIFGLIFLITIKAGLLFAIISEWYSNLEIGVSFAVQSYKSTQDLPNAIEGIQQGLVCCGRESASDYRIANTALVNGYVPRSCCDLNRFSMDYCSTYLIRNNTASSSYDTALKQELEKMKSPIKRGVGKSQSIPLELSSKKGCMDQLNWVVLPTIIGIFGVMILSEIMCILASSIHIKTSSLLSSTAEDLKQEQSKNTSPYRHEIVYNLPSSIQVLNQNFIHADSNSENENDTVIVRRPKLDSSLCRS